MFQCSYLIAHPTAGDSELRVEVAKPKRTEKPIENLPLFLSDLDLLLQFDWGFWLLILLLLHSSSRRHRREPVTTQIPRNDAGNVEKRWRTKGDGWETATRRRAQQKGSREIYNSVDWERERQCHGVFKRRVSISGGLRGVSWVYGPAWIHIKSELLLSPIKA